MRDLIQRIFKVEKSLNKLFNCSLAILKEYGINTQNLSISLNTQRIGRTKIVAETSRPIDNTNESKTGEDSRVWLKRQNIISLTQKFKKLLIKSVDHGNS